jgi:hypothetical protein
MPPHYGVDTVYLNGPHTPGDKTHLSGFTEVRGEMIAVSDRDDWRGQIVFFPMHLVIRVEKNTGWK